MIEAKQATGFTVLGIADNDAIEYDGNGNISATGYLLNFWMDVDQTRKPLTIFTYGTLRMTCTSLKAELRQHGQWARL
jgi:hypothetical protein